MKKIISLLLVICMGLSVTPALAALPYEITEELTGEGTIGVKVKKKDTYKDDFTLYATYGDGEYIYDIKKVDSSLLTGEDVIAFDKKDGAEIKLFAWDESMQPAEDLLEDLDYATVMSQMKTVNDYYIKEHGKIYENTNTWDVAVYHTGNMMAYFMTGDELYRNYSQKWSEVHSYKSFGYPTWDDTNADNICCFRTYMDLYNAGTEGADISFVQDRVDNIVNSYRVNYWDWIDAFYMAAPTFVRMYEMTGDEKYLDKMYEMIKYTAEELNCYDEDEGLWYRDARYINQKSENGKKIFWSRGDAWVYAAFAQIIEELPDSYEHKSYFEDVFLAMSKALKETQCPSGAWHESLQDKEYNPDCEMSGTGFFTYGMLWGINNGYLDEDEYLYTALRGWRWLTEVAMQESGHIGYVQHIGAEPTKNKLYPSTTEDYAYAIFVFAASEMAKYLGGVQGDVLPYLHKKLLGNIEVYKDGADYAIKKGEIIESSIKCEEIVVPEGMYLYKYNDLCILSEFITPFNKTETNLLDMLSDILDKGTFPEREYSDPDRIEIIKNPQKWADAVSATTTAEPSATVAEAIDLTAENITMSYVAEEHNGAANVIDSDYSTRMALQVLGESPEYIDIDLGDEYELSHIGMSFYLGNQRKNYFKISVSTDGESYSEVLPLSYSSGTSIFMEYYPIDIVKTRYVRIYGYGNNTTSYTWFSMTELKIYQSLDEDLSVSAVEANLEGLLDAAFTPAASIETESENNAGNINDGKMDTYCVLYVEKRSKPQYIDLDLGSVMDVEYVALAFRSGTKRQTAFRIDISEDGESFTTAVPKCLSTGETDNYEYYLIDKKARYIRVYGYYNTVYNPYWVSFTEAKVFVN